MATFGFAFGGCRSQTTLTGFAFSLLAIAGAAAVNPLAAQTAKQTTPAGDAPGQAGQATDSLGDPLPLGAIMRFGTVRFRPPSTVRDLALAPDEKTLVSIGRQLIAWDVESGKERWRAEGNSFGFSDNGASYGGHPIAFSADSSHLYSVGRQNEIVIWNLLDGKKDVIALKPNEAIRQLPTRGAASIAITTDGSSIAVGNAAGLTVVSAHNWPQGYEITNTPNEGAFDGKDRLRFGGAFCSGQFSPDGQLLAVVSSDVHSTIRLYRAGSGQELRRIPLKDRLVRMAFSPDGARIAATERDSAVRTYDVDSAKELWSHVVALKDPNENYTSAIAYSPDGSMVAVCATDEKIYLIDAMTGDERGVLAGHSWYPWAVTFSADSKMLYSSGWDGAIRRWNVAAREQLPPPRGVRGSALAAASPDGKIYAFQDDLGTIHLIDVATGAERSTLALPQTRYATLAFSHDSQRLAGGGGSGDQLRVVVWNLPAGDVAQSWDWPRGSDPKSTIESLEFSPDGRRLAAAVFRQSAAYLWDLAAGQQLAKIDHKQVYGLSFNPDSKTLATAGWDRAVRFWDTDTAQQRREFVFEKADPNEDTRMYAVCYAPQGGLLATAHLNGAVRIWRADDMTQLKAFGIAGRFVFGAIRFSPDGLWLATGNSTGVLTLWDPLNGTKALPIGNHADSVYTLAFGARGRTLVSGGSDGVGYVWNLRPSEPPADLDRQWNDLTGDDSAAAYAAMWNLAATPERTARLVAERLRAVKTVISPLAPYSETAATSPAPDPPAGSERWLNVRRAIALLSGLDHPQAAQALAELSNEAACDDVKRLAAEARQHHEPKP